MTFRSPGIILAATVALALSLSACLGGGSSTPTPSGGGGMPTAGGGGGTPPPSTPDPVAPGRFVLSLSDTRTVSWLDDLRDQRLIDLVSVSLRSALRGQESVTVYGAWLEPYTTGYGVLANENTQELLAFGASTAVSAPTVSGVWRGKMTAVDPLQRLYTGNSALEVQLSPSPMLDAAFTEIRPWSGAGPVGSRPPNLNVPPAEARPDVTFANVPIEDNGSFGTGPGLRMINGEFAGTGASHAVGSFRVVDNTLEGLYLTGAFGATRE